MSDFNDIAQIALVEANQHLGVTGSESGELSMHYIKHPKTLLNWFWKFWNTDTFPNSSKLRSLKSKLPSFLQDNADFIEAVHSYCKENLSSLSVERLHNHIHANILPQLVTSIGTSQNVPNYNLDKLLSEYHLKGKICVSTVCSWMKMLGYVYGLRQKSYYVDNHEKPQT